MPRDSATARDFMPLLPRMLAMNALLKLAKFTHLPGDPSAGEGGCEPMEVGDVVDSPPDPDPALFHRHDGWSASGDLITIVTSRVDARVESLDVLGSVDVTVVLAQ